jgi:molecular chaperone Hsp33
MTAKPSDTLQRFMIGLNGEVRGVIVILEESWQTVHSRRNYPETIRTLFGQAIGATHLLSATIIKGGALSLQIQSDALVELIHVQARADRSFRGLAKWRDLPSHSPTLLYGAQGQFAITYEPAKASGKRYQSLIPLSEAPLSSMIEHYFNQSEQIDTHLLLAANNTRVCGIMLQRMPDIAATEEDLWNRLSLIFRTLSEDQLISMEASDILNKLFHSEHVKIFPPEHPEFRCECSREKIEAVLISLGENEVKKLLAERACVDVDCDYCMENYHFDAVDIDHLFMSTNLRMDTPSTLQ